MRRIMLGVILIITSLASAHAAESDVTFVAGVDFGFKRLSLIVGSESGGGGGSFDASYVTFNPTIAMGVGSFYVSFGYDKTIDAETKSGEEDGGGTPTATLLDFSRADSTLTFGYRLNPSFSVFGGYTQGINSFTETGFSNNALKISDITYTEKGPFLGVSYNKSFSDKGSLGLSLGYAMLDGELKFVRHGGGAPTSTEVATGDNTGLSYGVTWSGSLIESLGFRVGLKQTRYEMKKGPDNPQDLTEKYTTLSFGVTSYF